jgi:probable H4MPT-linked C1 transfer pathway protein
MILGLDIGGANLKAATTDRRAAVRPFALWNQPDQLKSILAELVEQFSEAEELAVTMTGELCDCFRTKRDGVNHILNAVLSVSRSRSVGVWTTDGEFVNTEQARNQYLKVASANWHALATLAGNYAPRGTTLLIDIGSTTTDLIPILNGVPWCQGTTDTARLRFGELVYTGVKRTPATTLLGLGYAAELFATVQDAYVLLGQLPENPCDTDTVDGRPVTRDHAHARLSRMICGDPDVTPLVETEELAKRIVDRQQNFLVKQVEALIPRLRDMQRSALHPHRSAILSGSGEFLATTIIRQFDQEFDEVLSLSDRLGADLSTCAPAYAVAMLLSERRS